MNQHSNKIKIILQSAPPSSLHFVNCLPQQNIIDFMYSWLVTAHLFQNITYEPTTRTNVNNIYFYTKPKYIDGIKL